MVRVVAMAALVLGIVVMHHVVRPDHEMSAAHQSSAMATAERVVEHGMSLDTAPAVGGSSGSAMGDEVPSTSHGLLHLCLAVLTAAVLVLAGWLLLARRPWTSTSPFVAFRVRPIPARPPPRPHGSALLTSLCVMRT